MKVSDAFPSNYIKSSDLQGRTFKLVIARYSMEKLGDDNKLVLFFQGAEKGLVCNKTNATEIADSFSDDLDQWIGREIELYVARVDFQGKKTDGLRVRIPQRDQVMGQSTQAPPAQNGNTRAPLPAGHVPF